MAAMPKPKVGDERYLVEMIDARAVEAMARTAGWDGEDGLREFCEPQDAAVYSVHKSLDEAVSAAHTWLATGRDFYGCAIIDHQVFEKPIDDTGNLIRVPPQWKRRSSYEVTMDGECIIVER